MKKIALILLGAAMLSCEKSPLFEEYNSFSGTWKIVNPKDSTLNNTTIEWGNCVFKNKNLKNGNHACVGNIKIGADKLNFTYKILENNKIDFYSVATESGSTDPSKTSLPLDLFKGTWEYSQNQNSASFTKRVSNNPKFMNYQIAFNK